MEDKEVRGGGARGGEEVVEREAVEETDMLNGGGCNLMQSVVFLTWIRVAALHRSLQLRALMSAFFSSSVSPRA